MSRKANFAWGIVAVLFGLAWLYFFHGVNLDLMAAGRLHVPSNSEFVPYIINYLPGVGSLCAGIIFVIRAIRNR